MSLDGAQLLRADVERFCAELVNHPPAVRLRSLAALRAMLDEPCAITTVDDLNPVMIASVSHLR